MEHEHMPTPGKRLFFTIVLNSIITIVEIIGGLISGSLSLLSDAIHNFSDCIAIIISYIAIRLSHFPRTHKYTFGLKRVEILAALLNAGVLIVICFFFFKESYERLKSPTPISGSLMIIVASVGLIANWIGALLLKKGSKASINIRSAYLHLVGDTVSSAAVIIGGICIYFFKIYWIDPILTIAISAYILKESFLIVKEAVNVLMMGTPETVSMGNIREEIEDIPGVKNIHHVHIWRLNERDIHLEAHVDVEDMPVSKTGELTALIEKKLKQNHGIGHITLQFETDICECKELV
jgi:cobalt-zinc-cadmium efflux system protein